MPANARQAMAARATVVTMAPRPPANNALPAARGLVIRPAPAAGGVGGGGVGWQCQLVPDCDTHVRAAPVRAAQGRRCERPLQLRPFLRGCDRRPLLARLCVKKQDRASCLRSVNRGGVDQGVVGRWERGGQFAREGCVCRRTHVQGHVIGGSGTADAHMRGGKVAPHGHCCSLAPRALQVRLKSPGFRRIYKARRPGGDAASCVRASCSTFTGGDWTIMRGSLER